MKRTIILLVGCFICLNLWSQDVMLKTDNTSIQCKVMEITEEVIKYKKWSNLDGPTYSIAIGNIQSITYQNGEVDTFSEQRAKVKEETESPNLITKKVDEKRRQEIINLYTPEVEVVTSKAKYNKYANLSKSKKEKDCMLSGYLLWRPSANSEVCNEDLEFHFVSENHLWRLPHFLTTYWKRYFVAYVRNRSDKVIYLDLASSFYDKNSYYNGTVTSSTKAQANGASVKSGSVTVGSATARSTTTTTVEQRYVSIPPGGEFRLPGMIEKTEEYVNGHGLDSLCEKAFHWEGDYVDIPFEPSGLDFIVTYSLSQDFSKYSTLKAKLVPFRLIMTLEYLPYEEFDEKRVKAKRGRMVINNAMHSCFIKSSQIIPPADNK